MNGIILAAGYATRLYPLTKNFPKPLLEVGGKPILDHLIDDIADAVDTITVVSNHRFYSAFTDWASGRQEKISVVDDGTETNETRLGAVKDLQLAVRGLTGDVLVMAGDNMLDFSLRGFIDFQRRTGTSCVMCHEENSLSALRKTAVITTDETGRITSYEEKPAQPRGSLAVPPFYIYREQDAARIEEALEDGCGYDAPGSFAAWLSRKTEIFAWRMEGHRYDIGDIASYENVKAIFADRQKSSEKHPGGDSVRSC